MRIKSSETSYSTNRGEYAISNSVKHVLIYHGVN
jgi:hypothetical protein